MGYNLKSKISKCVYQKVKIQGHFFNLRSNEKFRYNSYAILKKNLKFVDFSFFRPSLGSDDSDEEEHTSYPGAGSMEIDNVDRECAQIFPQTFVKANSAI